MYYDTQVIYSSGSYQNEQLFQLDGKQYYRTKTNKTKVLDLTTQKRTSITEQEYQDKWERFKYLFR